MILCVSTSSEVASLALFRADGSLVIKADGPAARRASGFLVSAVEESSIDLASIELFVADIGPGSLTGIKVGVTMAKAWGWAFGRPVAGINAFDLVASDRTVAIPGKRGEAFVRVPGEAPRVIAEDEIPRAAVLTGRLAENAMYALAERCIVSSLTPCRPEELTAEYLVEPSASVTKRPIIMGDVFGV